MLKNSSTLTLTPHDFDSQIMLLKAVESILIYSDFYPYPSSHSKSYINSEAVMIGEKVQKALA